MATWMLVNSDKFEFTIWSNDLSKYLSLLFKINEWNWIEFANHEKFSNLINIRHSYKSIDIRPSNGPH